MASQHVRSDIQSGRLHRRMRLTLPVGLLSPGEPELTQDAVTENVSPWGARVVVNVPTKPDALLLLKSPTHSFQTSVRVVYCEPLSGGQFGAGLQLQGPSVDWTQNLTDRVA